LPLGWRQRHHDTNTRNPPAQFRGSHAVDTRRTSSERTLYSSWKTAIQATVLSASTMAEPAELAVTIALRVPINVV